MMQLGLGDVRVPDGGNGYVPASAVRAADIELYSMPDDAAANLVADEAEDTLNRACVKLADSAACDTNGVMVVLRVGEGIARLSVDEAQLADDPRLQQQLDGAEDGGAADMRQITHKILSGETVGPFLEILDDFPAGQGGSVALVFKGCENVGTAYLDGHDTQSRFPPVSSGLSTGLP